MMRGLSQLEQGVVSSFLMVTATAESWVMIQAISTTNSKLTGGS